MRVKGFDRASLAAFCARLEETAARNCATIGPRVTRSRAAAASAAADSDEEPSVSSTAATRGSLFFFARDSRTENVLDREAGNLDNLY